MRTLLLLLLSLLLWPAAPSPAQDGAPPTRVRVYAPEFLPHRPVIGTLIGTDSGTLVVREDRYGEHVLNIPVGLIRSLEESRGEISPREGARKGLREGALAGGLAGGVGGLLWGWMSQRVEGESSADEGMSVAASGLWGGAGGLVAGSVIGATLGSRARERWERVPVPRVAVRPDGLTLSLALGR